MSTVRANAYLDASGGNTATINGIVPALSSQAQATAGSDNTTLMTPLRTSQAVGVSNSEMVKSALNAAGSAPVYAVRAWVNYTGSGGGGATTILASGNIASVTFVSTGTWQVNFTTAMQDANYSVTASADRGSGNIDVFVSLQNLTASSFQLIALDQFGGTINSTITNMCATVIR
jgi:hypothetical protein